MSLDLVEMVMEVEEAFGIELPDDVLNGMSTVGDLYIAVLERLNRLDGQGGYCVNLFVFALLRKGMRHILKESHPPLRLDHGLEEYFPRKTRRRTLKLLSEKSELQLPELLPTSKLIAPVVMLSAFLMPWAIYHIGGHEALVMTPRITILMSIISLFIAHRLLKPVYTSFPSGMSTFRDLIKAVAELNVGLATANRIRATEEEAWRGLTSIIERTTGIAAETIRPEHRVVQDLGLG